MQDFLWAVAAKLRRLFPANQGEEGHPVYFGRLWQGEKTPCFYLPPPRLKRQLWPCGRVRREIGLELHYYPGRKKTADELVKAGTNGVWAEQARVGEGLVRGMAELSGQRRGYRGHELSWQPGNEYLRFQGKYVYYTTLEQEGADGFSDLPENAELMQFFDLQNF